MKIKIEPFLMKKGNRVAKAAVEFEATDGFLAGFHLVGFTICDDAKGLFVMFPSSTNIKFNKDGTVNKDGAPQVFFFLRPNNKEQIIELEKLILDTYEDMVSFNNPKGK